MNILVGETTFLRHPVAAFVRLREAARLGEMTEVPVPTRFMFILLGSQGNGAKYQAIGRAIGTLFSDEVSSGSIFLAVKCLHPRAYIIWWGGSKKVEAFEIMDLLCSKDVLVVVVVVAVYGGNVNHVD